MEKEYIIGTQRISCRIIRSARKSVEIGLLEDGGLVLRAPNAYPEAQLDQIVAGKGDWILKKRNDLRIRQESIKIKKECENFLYLGKEYKLRVIKNQQKNREQPVREVILKEAAGELWVLLSDEEELFSYQQTGQEAVLPILYRFYFLQMKAYLKERILEYRQLIPSEIGTIKIKDLKSRWGSCSVKKNLNFNVRLIMAPPQIADYVIVHELCHLIEMNHSKRFWTEVERILPDYRERKRWLREHGGELLLR